MLKFLFKGLPSALLWKKLAFSKWLTMPEGKKIMKFPGIEMEISKGISNYIYIKSEEEYKGYYTVFVIRYRFYKDSEHEWVSNFCFNLFDDRGNLVSLIVPFSEAPYETVGPPVLDPYRPDTFYFYAQEYKTTDKSVDGNTTIYNEKYSTKLFKVTVHIKNMSYEIQDLGEIAKGNYTQKVTDTWTDPYMYYRTEESNKTNEYIKCLGVFDGELVTLIQTDREDYHYYIGEQYWNHPIAWRNYNALEYYVGKLEMMENAPPSSNKDTVCRWTTPGIPWFYTFQLPTSSNLTISSKLGPPINDELFYISTYRHIGFYDTDIGGYYVAYWDGGSYPSMPVSYNLSSWHYEFIGFCNRNTLCYARTLNIDKGISVFKDSFAIPYAFSNFYKYNLFNSKDITSGSVDILAGPFVVATKNFENLSSKILDRGIVGVVLPSIDFRNSLVWTLFERDKPPYTPIYYFSSLWNGGYVNDLGYYDDLYIGYRTKKGVYFLNWLTDKPRLGMAGLCPSQLENGWAWSKGGFNVCPYAKYDGSFSFKKTSKPNGATLEAYKNYVLVPVGDSWHVYGGGSLLFLEVLKNKLLVNNVEVSLYNEIVTNLNIRRV